MARTSAITGLTAPLVYYDFQTRVFASLLFVGPALAQGAPGPVEEVPWTSLGQALGDAKACNVPLVVLLHSGGDTGKLPEALAGEDAAAIGFELPAARVDLADEKWMAGRVIDAALLDGAPALLVLAPGGELIDRVPLSTRPESLGAILEAASRKVGPRKADLSEHLWDAAQEFAAGSVRGFAVPYLARVRKIEARAKKLLAFADEARRLEADLMAEGETKLELLKKAIEQKDWRAIGRLRVDLHGYRETRLGAAIEAAVAPIAGDRDATRGYDEAWEAYRREVQRPDALAALRLRVPAEEVADADVTVVFWEAVMKPSRLPRVWHSHEVAFFVGGYWLGKSRFCALTWSPEKNELVATGQKYGEGDRYDLPPFVDLVAKDDETRRAFELDLTRTRSYEGRIVPVKIDAVKDGVFNMTFLDGWDWGCGHLSFGWLEVDLKKSSVRLLGHVM